MQCSISTGSSRIAAPRCAQDPSHKAAREVVARAVSDPAAVLAGARRADAGPGSQPLYKSATI